MSTVALALGEEPLALVQAAHEDPHLDKLSKAPDRSYLVPKNVGSAGFCPGTKLEFTWGWGPVEMNFSIDRLTLQVLDEVFIWGCFGKIKVLTLEGNLKDGVSGSCDHPYASGSVDLALRNGNEVWVVLNISSPFYEKIDKQFLVVKL
ncbi:unnamed protein product [Rhizoctonia solani]|uniref:Uncharacterized protein n=1 Tax=Rhizoctonia solani TaxID=456999 RepID=A0A8H3HXA9_9AGAM|nr:unnamed protein product [Rhizoctonia solani]